MYLVRTRPEIKHTRTPYPEDIEDRVLSVVTTDDSDKEPQGLIYTCEVYGRGGTYILEVDSRDVI